jgi:hypothetical protein
MWCFTFLFSFVFIATPWPLRVTMSSKTNGLLCASANELKELCRTDNLSTSGTKSELMARLVDNNSRAAKYAVEATPITAAMVSPQNITPPTIEAKASEVSGVPDADADQGVPPTIEAKASEVSSQPPHADQDEHSFVVEPLTADATRFRLEVWDYAWEVAVRIRDAGKASDKSGIEQNLKEANEVRNHIGKITDTDPFYVSVPRDDVDFSAIEKRYMFLFCEKETLEPLAPVLWPAKHNISIAVLSGTLPERGYWKRYAGDLTVKAYWYAISLLERSARLLRLKEGRSEVEVAKLLDLKTRLEGFEALGHGVVYDFRVFASHEEREIAAFQELENTEEARANEGFTGTRKILLALWAAGCTKKLHKGKKTVTHGDIASFIAEKLNFADSKTQPSEYVVRDLLRIGKLLVKSPKAMQAMKTAESLWSRNTFFDDYSKLLQFATAASSPEEFGNLLEAALLFMLCTTPLGQNPKPTGRDELIGKAGDIEATKLCQKSISWLLQAAGKPDSWKANSANNLIKTLLNPKDCFHLMVDKKTYPDEVYSSTSGAETQMLVGALRSAPHSLKVAASMCLDLHRRAPRVISVVKGVLASPPSDGIDLAKHVFSKSFPEAEWDSFNEAVAEETDNAARRNSDDGLTTPLDTVAVDGMQAAAAETASSGPAEPVDVKRILADEVEVKIDEIFRLGVVVASPESWTAACISVLLGEQVPGKDERCVVAFFDPKAYRDPRIAPTKNWFKSYPALDSVAFTQFCEGVAPYMLAGKAVFVVLEGKVPENRNIILKTIESMRWSKKEVILLYDEKSMESLILSGADAKRFREVHSRGFATTKSTEVMYFIYKDRMPKVLEKFRRHVDSGSSVSSNVLKGIEVVQRRHLGKGTEIQRHAIFKGTGFATKDASTVQASSSGSSSDESAAADEVAPAPQEKKVHAKKKKRTERNRALTRTPTKESEVDIFLHPTPPQLVREILCEFKPSLFINGTPAVGHAAEACAAEHVLSLNLVRNSAHKEFFENSLRSRLRRLFRHPGNDLGQAHLYKRWKEAKDEASTEDGASSTDEAGLSSASDVDFELVETNRKKRRNVTATFDPEEQVPVKKGRKDGTPKKNMEDQPEKKGEKKGKKGNSAFLYIY